MKHIAIIGTGPGGLTAGVIPAKHSTFNKMFITPLIKSQPHLSLVRRFMVFMGNYFTGEENNNTLHKECERSRFVGAMFNLVHTIMQMRYLRLRNKFDEINHCYLVAGGMHPGSGLPIIYESGRILTKLIDKYGM
jgi:phytoene dehydrogenase-like protein